jgi:hypothetical protein
LFRLLKLLRLRRKLELELWLLEGASLARHETSRAERTLTTYTSHAVGLFNRDVLSWTVPKLERKCGIYDPNSWKYAQILSPFEAEELFEFVQTFLAEKNARSEVSADTFKVNSRYTTDSDELAIEVKILKGEGLYCLDVEKLIGSHFDLMELFKDMAFSLEEHTKTLVTEA